MRKKMLLTLGLGAALAVAIAAVAMAKYTTFVVGDLVLQADGGVTPKALPKNKFTPVTVHVAGKISTKDHTHPPAFREAVIDFDKNGMVNAKGLTVCKGGQLEARTTAAAKQACPKSIVGTGTTKVEIAFAEQPPIFITSPVTAFNGGVKGGTTTIYLHAYITKPIPAAIVTTVKITKIHSGRYGLHTVSTIPKISGGSGSILEFNLNFSRSFTYKGKKQSYFEAKCPDGHFDANIKSAKFQDETGTGVGDTVIKGLVERPCTPKG